ncbi:MAG: DUF1292 domain-containing protein [Ruminococcaceae bacterium]|nr:DUF1292 domain-containing protein [Oscillospiraceae bacterium]
MSENMNNEADFFTLTDEEGNEIEFEVLADYELNGTRYFAMMPIEDEEADEAEGEFVILKLVQDGDELVFDSVFEEDPDFVPVAEYFENYFSSEIDYDN